MQVEDKREPQTLVEGKYFRVHTISKVIGIDHETHNLQMRVCSIRDGLAIEKRGEDIDNKPNYFVVAFVEPHEKKHNPLESETVSFVSMNSGIDLIDVNFRTVQMIKENMSMEDLWEMMQEYKNCVEFAQKVVLEALGEEYDG